MAETTGRRRTAFVRDWANWAALAILALALLLRMGWPTLAEFKRDESKVVRLALSIAYEGHLPAVGVGSSIGTANLPLTLYLTALPLRVWQDPLAVALFVGLLNGLAVWACYALGRACFGRAAGLLAAFLFAVNPWAVVYGRKMWSQNLPLVTLGFFAALFAAFVRRRPWALVGAFVGLAALIGLHLGGLAFVPVLLALLVLYRRQVALRPLLLGVFLLALALAPYVVHDALRGWPILRAFFGYAGGEARFSWDALRYAFSLTGSAGIEGLAGARHAEYLAGLPNLWCLNGAMMGLLALALLYGLVQVIRGSEDRRRVFLMLLLWFAVPVAMQSRPSAPAYPHYFILLYPVQFLLIAATLADLCSRVVLPRLPRLDRRLLYALVGAVLLVWGGWQVAVVGRLFVFMDRYPLTGGYGIPLKYTRAAALEARRLAGPAEIVVLGRGTNPEVDETPSVFGALLFGHPHRFADGRSTLPAPDSSRVVYVVGPLEVDDPGELGPVLSRLEAMDHGHMGPAVTLPGGWAYQLSYRDSHRDTHRDGPDREDVLAGMARFADGITFANGVVFMGYEVAGEASAGGTLEVWLAWWVRDAPPPGKDYHFFAHLVDEEGGLRSQYDVMGFPSGSWRAGDVVLSRFPIPIPQDLPAGCYQVWAGLYSYPDVVNVSFLDVAGNPAGERVMLGEVEVGGP